MLIIFCPVGNACRFVCMCARDCVVFQEIPWIIFYLVERRIIPYYHHPRRAEKGSYGRRYLC